MARRVLVVSAHPDDETLGCGGTLLQHVAAGDHVEWAIVTDGWEPLVDRRWLDTREKEIVAVQHAFGIARVHRLHQQTTKLASTPLGSIVDAFRDVFAAARPDILYTVHPGDVHDDHRVTFDAAFAAAKPFRAGAGIRSIYAYETISSTNMAPPLGHRAFVPQVYSDITPFLRRKIEIFALFASEVQAVPGPRSPEAIEALARWRGCAVGMDYAEAFVAIRHIL